MVAITVTPPRASDDSNLVRVRGRALTLTLTLALTLKPRDRALNLTLTLNPFALNPNTQIANRTSVMVATASRPEVGSSR